MDFHRTKKWKNKRENILKRDIYKCRQCIRYGKTKGATTVHHVIPISEDPKLKLVNKNLISLCSDCHNKMHDRTNNKLTRLGEEWRDRIYPPH